MDGARHDAFFEPSLPVAVVDLNMGILLAKGVELRVDMARVVEEVQG